MNQSSEIQTVLNKFENVGWNEISQNEIPQLIEGLRKKHSDSQSEKLGNVFAVEELLSEIYDSGVPSLTDNLGYSGFFNDFFPDCSPGKQETSRTSFKLSLRATDDLKELIKRSCGSFNSKSLINSIVKKYLLEQKNQPTFIDLIDRAKQIDQVNPKRKTYVVDAITVHELNRCAKQNGVERDKLLEVIIMQTDAQFKVECGKVRVECLKILKLIRDELIHLADTITKILPILDKRDHTIIFPPKELTESPGREVKK